MDERLRRHGVAPFSAVAVHGGPGTPGSAYSLAAGLSAFIGTIEPFQQESTLTAQIEELYQQITECADVPATVFGHSWGAWLSCYLASQYPHIVNKLFLISSGPLEEKYVGEISQRRASRLSAEEHLEYQAILRKLSAESGSEKDVYLKKLGELTSKSDNYDIENQAFEHGRTIKVDGAQYQSVWYEGVRLRKQGVLLKAALSLSIPIVIIHGAEDPHPPEGVIDPLRKKSKYVTSYVLDRCGHHPWKEKYAKERFWQIIRAELNCA